MRTLVVACNLRLSLVRDDSGCTYNERHCDLYLATFRRSNIQHLCTMGDLIVVILMKT